MATRGLEHTLLDLLSRNGVRAARVEVRTYPNETNALVYVNEGAYARALEVADEVERDLEDEFGADVLVVVRKERDAAAADSEADGGRGVHAAQAAELVRLVAARNRVSEVQPSLSYVRDLASNVATVTAERHHLVFGRRGAGKSTLLVEARRRVEASEALTAWVNLQTLRREEPHRVFLRIARDIVGSVLTALNSGGRESEIVGDTSDTYDHLGRLIRKEKVTKAEADRVIPDVQHVLKRGLGLLGTDLYVFIDDFYYVARQDQPELLDILHGCVRDSRTWLKIASIRHLTRWFVATPPRGLQTGQDADIIDLDVTLEDPVRVRTFLTTILQQYATEVGIPTLGRIYRAEALDRLVLASGGVPRDFLVLGAAAIGKARERENARQVGVQDINQVAGEAAAVKIQELEEDLAANAGVAGKTLEALAILRKFCLNEKSATFYGVDFFDKEIHASEYQVFTDLLDLRLVHLIHSSVSHPHEAGRRYEIFMLDLSQYSGSRLKQGLRVLDLQGDQIVSRRTREAGSIKRATTPKQLLGMLRTAPTFDLERFGTLATEQSKTTSESKSPRKSAKPARKARSR